MGKDCEKWTMRVIFQVEGKETYTNESEWKDISPKKVKLMEVLLAKGQEEFVKRATS
jgi:hypothetical protein